MIEINRLEKDSILYYQWGGEKITLSNERQDLREFYDINNSYIVFNALLMPGISNERTRLLEEGKQITLIIFEYMEEVIEVYCRLYSAMCKYTCYYEHEKQYHTYRDDRMNTLEFLKYGQMLSFMSTRKNNDKNTDFHGKNGLLLLEVEAQGDMEHVDVNAVLQGESIYPHENEILFAPFVLLDKEPLEMTEEEKSYKDINGEPPKAKYLLHLRSSSITPCNDDINKKELEKLYAQIMDSDSVKTIGKVWEIFMAGNEPEETIVKKYVDWKEKFQRYLRLRFAGIKYNVMCKNQNADEEEYTNLVEDVRTYYKYTNRKRKKYRNCTQIANVMVSILYSLATLFVALSFQSELQDFMKVASLVAGGIGTIIPLIAKGLAWNENLRQRTMTYLALDELMRDMKYERNINKDSVDKYVERYKAIVHKDNEMGLESAGIMGAHLDRMTKEYEKKQEK